MLICSGCILASDEVAQPGQLLNRIQHIANALPIQVNAAKARVLGVKATAGCVASLRPSVEFTHAGVQHLISGWCSGCALKGLQAWQAQSAFNGP